MIYYVTIGDRTLEVELRGDEVVVDGASMAVDFGGEADAPLRSFLIDGASHRVAARADGEGRWSLHFGSLLVRAEVVDGRTRAIRAMTGKGAATLGPRPVVAPMPGMVVRVEVSEGDEVRGGQGVVIVEAMKMENELLAEAPGVVERIHVREGEAVEKDQLLVELAPLPQAGEE